MKMKEIGYVIFGRRGRHIGLLGLGATTLLTPARVMGGITLAAAGIWTVVNLHPDSSGADRSAGHARPAAHNVKLTRHTQGRDGIADLSTSGGKLLLAMNRTASDRGKGGDPTPGHLASGASATHSGFLAAGSWSPAFGHHAAGAPASHSNIPPPPSSNSPGSPNLKESAHVGSGPGAGSPPGHSKEFGPDSAPTPASVQHPEPAPDDPSTPSGSPGSPGSNGGTADDDSAIPRGDSGLPNDNSGDLGGVPGDPDGQGGVPGDLGGISPEDPGKLSLPDTFSPSSVPESSDFPIDLGDIPPEGPGLSLPITLDTLAPLSVPEPSSTALFSIGLLGLGWARRRLQAAARPGLFTIQLQESPDSGNERKDYV